MNVFVYGSLLSKQERARALLYPREEAFIFGRLYDCPFLGFPFAVLFSSTISACQSLCKDKCTPIFDTRFRFPLAQCSAILPRIYGELVHIPNEQADQVLDYLDTLESGVPCYQRATVTAMTNSGTASAEVYYAPSEEAIYACGVHARLYPVPSGRWESVSAYTKGVDGLCICSIE